MTELSAVKGDSLTMKTNKWMRHGLMSMLIATGLSFGMIATVNPGRVMADETQVTTTNNKSGRVDQTRDDHSVHFDWTLVNGKLTIKDGASFEFPFVGFPLISLLPYDQNGIDSKEVKQIVFEGVKITGDGRDFLAKFTEVTDIDASKLDVSELTNATKFFCTDHKLKTIDISGPSWRHNQINDMGNMFADSGITTIKGLSELDTSNVTTMMGIFNLSVTSDPYQWTKTVADAIKNWDVSQNQDFQVMFWAYSRPTYNFGINSSMLWIDISNWNITASPELNTELMLQDIQQITLGKNTNFQLRPEAFNPTIHKAPTDPNKPFTYYLDENTVITVPLTGTGNWQFVGDGNPLYPAGGSLTAKAIEDQYQVGVEHPQEPRTFVFEHNTNLNLNVDESDVKLAAGQTFDFKESFKSLTAPGDASTVITPNRPLTYDEAIKLGLKVTGTDKIDYDKGGTFPITYHFHGKEATVKVTVPAKAHPTTPSNNGGGSSTPTTPTTPTKPAGTPSTPAVTPGKPTTSEGKPAANQKQADQKQADQLEIPSYAAKKRQAVYAINRIYLYKHANFNKQQRLVSYPKQKRVDRPMFVVIDYARANNGALRYKVRDVNHTKKSDGKIGYITADWQFVRPVYYRSMPKNHKVTVINHRGVHAYKNKNLTGRAHTYKVGKHLTVKKLVKHNLTTRYQLSNGYYVTANKKLVIQGTY